jgi:hypothetical protein
MPLGSSCGRSKGLWDFAVGCVLARTRRIDHRRIKMRACKHAPYGFAYFYHKGLARPFLPSGFFPIGGFEVERGGRRGG